jgi:uncharacterized protein (DUF849 family)
VPALAEHRIDLGLHGGELALQNADLVAAAATAIAACGLRPATAEELRASWQRIV